MLKIKRNLKNYGVISCGPYYWFEKFFISLQMSQLHSSKMQNKIIGSKIPQAVPRKIHVPRTNLFFCHISTSKESKNTMTFSLRTSLGLLINLREIAVLKPLFFLKKQRFQFLEAAGCKRVKKSLSHVTNSRSRPHYWVLWKKKRKFCIYNICGHLKKVDKKCNRYTNCETLGKQYPL